MVRRLVVLTVLLAGFAAVASPRVLAATITCPEPQPQTLSSPHFILTYNDAHGSSDAVTQSQAQGVLSGAEQAYDTFVAMGFTPPALGGGKLEIDVLNLTSQGISAMYCVGAFDYDSATIGSTGADKSLYGAVFTQFAYGRGVDIAYLLGTPGAPDDDWLVQGLSEWAAVKALGYPSFSTSDLGPWDISLDCVATVDPLTGSQNQTCSKTGYENDRESFWPFYEYLAEKYGSPGFAKELMDDAALSYGIPGLQAALTAHGSTLATEYGNFAGKLLSGGWTASLLNTVSPPTSATIQTGAATGDTSPQSIRVGHLASRYVQIDRGDGDAKHKCYTATLTINVTLPSGVASQPVFYWATANSSPVALSVSGSTATATLPWDTCLWSAHGYLSLPNESTTVDNAYFLVSTHIDVTKTETTATAPSTPANSYGNASDTSSAQGTVPSISLLGPGTMKVKSTATSLTVVLQSSDQGRVSAALGSSSLGSQAIVAGTNKLTFKIAPGTGDKTLTLTPLTSDGTVSGAAVSLKVSVAQPVQKLTVKKTKQKHAKKGKKTVRRK